MNNEQGAINKEQDFSLKAKLDSITLCLQSKNRSPIPGPRSLFMLCVLLAVISPVAWAGGRGQVETVTAEGNETWQHNFDVKGRGKGTYNYVVNTFDHAGNETVSGPFNINL